MRQVIGIIGLLLILAGAVFASEEDVTALSIPAGAAPVLDGVLSEGEWDDALILPLSDSASLYVKHAEGFLYLGVKTQTGSQVVGNITIARGDTIEIHHASYALGPATYRLSDDVWRLENAFVWSCRTLGFSSAAILEREMFLEANGWLATVVRLGVTDQMEYQISIEDEPMRMLFRFDVHRAATQDMLTWPLDTQIGIDPGPLPQEAAFHPGTWCEVSFDVPNP